ncbi:MAG: PhzF family phenazine biosynthesis protein [Legionella sp.]
MSSIEIFQIDAFTDKVFHGNPAAVCILTEWLNDELMQAIAAENNLSETAFIIEDERGFHIRWFTPNGEISLCGHATLAAGFALLESGKANGDVVHFNSLSGVLSVERDKDVFILDFPKLNYNPASDPESIAALIDQPVAEVYTSDLDYLVVLKDESAVFNAQIELKQLTHLSKRGLIITAASDHADFYSRCFYPKHNIAEDPVTGSAHCVLIPFWAERLQKTAMRAVQGYRRQGEILCELNGERVYIAGHCRWFMKGHLVI